MSARAEFGPDQDAEHMRGPHGLDAQDRRILELLVAGWPVQRLIVELDVEMSTITRIVAATRAQS
jgi:hypothetical protein